MKKRIVFLLFAIVTLLSINGCKKEDVKENGFTYKGTFYKAEMFGVFLSGGSAPELIIEISNADGHDENYGLTGNLYTLIKLHTAIYHDGNVVGLGEYVHATNATTPGTFETDGESFCHQHSPGSCVEGGNLAAGSLKVDKDGDDYILDYSFTLTSGETIKGYYKGALDYIDQS